LADGPVPAAGPLESTCCDGEGRPKVMSVGGGAALTSSVPSLSVSIHFSKGDSDRCVKHGLR